MVHEVVETDLQSPSVASCSAPRSINEATFCAALISQRAAKDTYTSTPVAIAARIVGALARHGASPSLLFQRLDGDADGEISRAELDRVVLGFEPTLPETALEEFFSWLSRDTSNEQPCLQLDTTSASEELESTKVHDLLGQEGANQIDHDDLVQAHSLGTAVDAMGPSSKPQSDLPPPQWTVARQPAPRHHPRGRCLGRSIVRMTISQRGRPQPVARLPQRSCGPKPHCNGLRVGVAGSRATLQEVEHLSRRLRAEAVSTAASWVEADVAATEAEPFEQEDREFQLLDDVEDAVNCSRDIKANIGSDFHAFSTNPSYDAKSQTIHEKQVGATEIMTVNQNRRGLEEKASDFESADAEKGGVDVAKVERNEIEQSECELRDPVAKTLAQMPQKAKAAAALRVQSRPREPCPRDILARLSANHEFPGRHGAWDCDQPTVYKHAPEKAEIAAYRVVAAAISPAGGALAVPQVEAVTSRWAETFGTTAVVCSAVSSTGKAREDWEVEDERSQLHHQQDFHRGRREARYPSGESDENVAQRGDAIVIASSIASSDIDRAAAVPEAEDVVSRWRAAFGPIPVEFRQAGSASKADKKREVEHELFDRYEQPRDLSSVSSSSSPSSPSASYTSVTGTNSVTAASEENEDRRQASVASIGRRDNGYDEEDFESHHSSSSYGSADFDSASSTSSKSC
eukprot:TRINITY_DN68742_c0_g1_i1.p1 TRINITY_DN68742_c0_g1~~TRINITY_DN68742_c0_g1_i1.p1  ORF type:complete len:698 (+),score=106.56 TRINITY_DN68742_c0_g1_i1:31-2094(+)